MKIRGTTVSTTMPRPDWNQTNPKKADYIKNKPDFAKELEGLKAELVAAVIAELPVYNGEVAE